MLEYFPKSNQMHKTLIIYLPEKRKVALLVKYIVACGEPWYSEDANWKYADITEKQLGQHTPKNLKSSIITKFPAG